MHNNNRKAYRSLEVISEDWGMSAQLRRKLRDATLECVKQYRSSHPGQTREQFKDESHELSKVFLNSRGIEFFTAEGAKWTWPRDRNIITDRVSEYLQTQNEYQKEKEGRNKRKFGEAEQSEEHEQERAKTRNRFSGTSPHLDDFPKLQMSSQSPNPAPAPATATAQTPDRAATSDTNHANMTNSNFENSSMRNDRSARGSKAAEDRSCSIDEPPRTKTFGLKFSTKTYELTAEQLAMATRFIMALYGDLSDAVRRAAKNDENISVAVDELDDLEQNIEFRLNKLTR